MPYRIYSHFFGEEEMLMPAAGQLNPTSSVIPNVTLEADFTRPPSEPNTCFCLLYFLLPLESKRILRTSSSETTVSVGMQLGPFCCFQRENIQQTQIFKLLF
jgi:hypothetical protein